MTAISNNVASIYGANAAPLATSIASLGAAIQAGSTNGGNTAVATGYSATPATTPIGTAGNVAANARALNTVAGTAAPAAIATAQQTIAALGTTPAAAPANMAVATSAQNTVASQFGSQTATDLTQAAGGGQITNALKTGVSSIVAFAQKGMADIQKAIQGDMAANNGEVDPAKMQLYTMKMSTYELLNQMAAKIQEKEEAAMQRWLR